MFSRVSRVQTRSSMHVRRSFDDHPRRAHPGFPCRKQLSPSHLHVHCTRHRCSFSFFASLHTEVDYATKVAVECQGLAKEHYARVCLPRSTVSSVGEPSALTFNMVANVSTSLQSPLTATATEVVASAGQ